MKTKFVPSKRQPTLRQMLTFFCIGKKVVGISFQGLNDAQSIGYIIPVLVIKHLLDDVKLHNTYTAFPKMAFQYQSMENSSYRKYLQLNDDQHGILVTSVGPACVLSNILQEDAVITAIDNVPIADDGTIYFRRGERLNFKHLSKLKFVGDTITFTLIRQGKKYRIFRFSVFRIIEIISPSE